MSQETRFRLEAVLAALAAIAVVIRSNLVTALFAVAVHAALAVAQLKKLRSLRADPVR